MKLTLKAWHIALLATFFAACTAGAGGGFVGAIATAIVIAAALVAACSPTDSKKNNEADFGPCLSAPYDAGTDAGFDADPDPDIGPCLTAPFRDMGPSDSGPDPLDVGPCLSQPLRDFGTPDTGDMGNPSDMGGVGLAPARERNEILERLGDRLPSDIASRLRGDDDKA